MLRALYPELFGFLPMLQSDSGGGTGGGNSQGAAGAGAGSEEGGTGGGEQGGNDGGAGDGDKSKVTFTTEQQEHFDAVLKERLAKATRSAAAEARKEERQKVLDEQKAAQAAEAGNFKELYETSQKRITELEADIKARDHKDLKAAAGAKYKLPTELVDRLIGDTADELEADAKKLAAQLGERSAADTEGGAGSGGAGGAGAGNGAGSNGRKTAKTEDTQPGKTSDGRTLVAWND